MEFEQIDNYHQRARVFGGWIVKSYDDVMTQMFSTELPTNGYEWRTSMVFVPDPNHEWEIS